MSCQFRNSTKNLIPEKINYKNMKKIENSGEDVYINFSDDSVFDKIRKFRDRFGIELKFGFGSPLTIEYSDEKYFISSERGDISFHDNRSKSVIIYFIETIDTVEFRLFDDTPVLVLEKIVL